MDPSPGCAEPSSSTYSLSHGSFNLLTSFFSTNMPKTLPCLQHPLINSLPPNPIPYIIKLQPFLMNTHYCYTVTSHFSHCQRECPVILSPFLLLVCERQAIPLARCYGLCSIKVSIPRPMPVLAVLSCSLSLILSLYPDSLLVILHISMVT